MQLYNICVIVLNAYIGYEMVVTAYKEELTLMYVFASSRLPPFICFHLRLLFFLGFEARSVNTGGGSDLPFVPLVMVLAGYSRQLRSWGLALLPFLYSSIF